MKTLFFGAGPLGSVYVHLLYKNGEDVTILARGERYAWLQENGLVLLNEITGQRDSSHIKVVNELKLEDEYDLVVVLIRKNKLLPVFEILAERPGVNNILVMGNNALGFEEYWFYAFGVFLQGSGCLLCKSLPGNRGGEKCMLL